jgi:hypothetical protein
MSGLKNLAKGGWHSGGKGEGGKESWRGDFKGVNTVVRFTACAHTTARFTDRW